MPTHNTGFFHVAVVEYKYSELTTPEFFWAGKGNYYVRSLREY
jgi:hypothetical protein